MFGSIEIEFTEPLRT